MARLFISSGDGTYEAGPSQTDLVGTDGVETVILQAQSKTVFDGSFNRGGDTIIIQGAASLYTARLSGSNVVLTAANGANIVIPVGTVGATLRFAGEDTGRTLVFADGAVTIGDQDITGAGVVLDDGDVVVPGGEELELSVGKDNLGGTAADDTIIGNVVQNQNGEQSNELGSGDRVDGGAGNDQMLVSVQDASPLNGGPASSINPITVDVETAHFTALSTGLTLDELEIDEIVRLFTGLTGESEFFGAGAQLGVEINAARMWGLDEVGSLNSDDSLTIYNLTTLTDTGVYEQRRLTEDVTVRMDHSGNGSLVELESDLTVLFDQNYLLNAGDVEAGAQLVIEIMDLDAALAGRDPLEDNPFGEIDFLLGGELFTLTYGTDANTYEELLADVQFALSQNPAFANLTASFGGTFVASDTDNDPGGSAEGTSIVITNDGPEELEAVTMRAIGDAPAGKDFHTNFEALEGETEGFLVTSNIVLNKVGRGGDGGDLTVGGQNTDGANVWGFGTSPTQQTPVQGVEQFNIVVEGDSSQPSDLASLQSTNNQLRVVNLASDEGSTATFTLGNNNTGNVPLLGTSIPDFFDDTFGGSNVDLSTFRDLALKDVLIFDATEFVNNSEVHAYFSEETVEKYLNRVDDGVDAPADNGNAAYTFGVGNNVLNVNLDKTNFENTGTVSREDFSFTADMGAGDDVVQIQIGDGFNAISGESSFDDVDMFDGGYFTEDGLQTVQNWYANHVINGDVASPVANLNENLVVNTGAGNDSVELWGATAADVDLGAGNDWIFTDNSGQIDDTAARLGDELPTESNGTFNGGKATWLFNQRSDDVNDLQSQTPVAISNVANLALRVTFQGLTAQAVVGNSAGSINGVTVSDLTINQAIKSAINNDPFLNKLLVAEDGPGRTLIVRSLIDGEHTELDLGIDLVSTGALTTAQQNSTALALGDLTGNALDVTPLGFTAAGDPATDLAENRWDSEFAFDSLSFDFGGELAGFDSINVNNNNVEGNTGDDLIVLSSNGIGFGIGVNSSTIGNSTETIDINGVFGEDRVLNFTAAVGLEPTAEVQSVAFTGTATGAGTVTVSYLGTDYTVPVDADVSDTPAGDAVASTDDEIATAIAAAITAGGLATATATDGTVVITNTSAVGTDIPEATVTIAPAVSAFESSVFTFSGDLTEGQVITLTFGGAEVGTTVLAADTIAAVIDRLAADAVGNPAFGTVTETDTTLTITAATSGDIEPDATASIVSSDAVDLDIDVATSDGSVFGLTGDPETVTPGTIPAQGFDIFDVTTVLNGAVDGLTFENQGQLDDIEAAAIALRVTANSNNFVLITDTVEQDDYGAFTGTPANELARITEIVRDSDTAAQTSATDGIIITVDANNVGTFYQVNDGVAANDSTVTRLGSVDLGTYTDLSKDAIGDWNLMSIANFTPLDVNGLEGTYDVIG